MGKYTKVHRGQALNISADAYNAFIDSISGESKMSSGGITDKRQYTVSGQNKTGKDLTPFSIVGIDGLEFEPEGDKFPPNFFFHPSLKLVAPDPEKHTKRFGIIQQQIKSGRAGPVLLIGITPVRVKREGTEDFEEAGFSDTEYLDADESGISILWHEKTNRGDWCWAFALLGAGGGSSSYRWGWAGEPVLNKPGCRTVYSADRLLPSNTLTAKDDERHFECWHDPDFPTSGVVPVGAAVRCTNINGDWFFDKVNY